MPGRVRNPQPRYAQIAPGVLRRPQPGARRPQRGPLRLTFVSVSPDGSCRDEVCYPLRPLKGFDPGDFAANGVRGDPTATWSRGATTVTSAVEEA